MCADCRAHHVEEVKALGELLCVLGEKLLAFMETEPRLTYIDVMEAGEVTCAELLPVLMMAAPALAEQVARERRRIVMSN